MARKKSLDSTLWLNEMAKIVNKSKELYVHKDDAKWATYIAWNEAIDSAIALSGSVTLATMKKPVPSSIMETVMAKRERSNAVIMARQKNQGDPVQQ